MQPKIGPAVALTEPRRAAPYLICDIRANSNRDRKWGFLTSVEELQIEYNDRKNRLQTLLNLDGTHIQTMATTVSTNRTCRRRDCSRCHWRYCHMSGFPGESRYLSYNGGTLKYLNHLAWCNVAEQNCRRTTEIRPVIGGSRTVIAHTVVEQQHINFLD